MPSLRRLPACLSARLSARPFTRPFSLRFAGPLLLSTLMSTLLLVSGCTHVGQAPQPVTGLQLAGRVQGGQQPVSGATIQLYTVGTSGDGSAATPLLNQTVQSDSAGSFSITGDYLCPSSTALVYLTASGGNPGLSAGTNNPNLAMMAALGQCGQLSATTYIFVDEVTTVGTAAALYPYMNSYATIGSGTADLNAFTTAFSSVNEFTNTANGTAPGPAVPSGYYASSTEIDTLGNILAPCVNSAGGSAGDGSLCGQLFQLAKAPNGAFPSDTATAIVNILKSPTQNVAALFNLSQPAPPFQPALTSAPSDWTLTIVQIPATPTFSLAAGTYTGTQTLSLSDSVAGAAIYYTTDGSTPTKASALYSGAFPVSSSETVKAIAIDGGRSSSAVASAAYTINTASTGIPVITSVSAIAAQQSQTITITGSGFGTKAAYTGASNFISVIDATRAFQAGYGYDTVTLVVTSWSDSQIVLGGFAGAYGGSYSLVNGDQIQLNIFNAQSGSGPGACNNIYVNAGTTTCTAVAPTATPVFSPAGGTYTSAQSVTLADATSGEQIYYTTDGSTPTTSSTLYSGPISVASSKVLKAYAFTFGNSASAVATATYTIGSSAGIISTFAGSGVQGNTGDGGAATSARLTSPYQMCLDPAGDVLVADYSGNRVRKITPSGIISTFAGTGASSSTGDGGLATAATINAPNGIACDTTGNVYIAEEHGIRVRKVTAAGVISTFAGTGVQGYAGDGGQAVDAGFVLPEGVAVDTSGNVYIADAYGNRIRKVNSAGIISTFAGTGSGGYNGDGLQATATNLSTPYAVLPDNAGNVYISDSSNNRVRKVNANGVVSTYAGNGNATFAGDNGQATSASINGALGITFDTAGNLYIADQDNYRIRKVTAAGIISTVAGNGIQGYTGDGGLATAAEVRIPEGVLTDSLGNLYIGDGANYVIRKVTYFNGVQAATPTFSPAAGTYSSAQTVTLSSATTGATLYYTLDGSTPTSASTVYTAPLVVSASETINAIAVAAGYTNSPVGTAAYTINTPTAAPPTASPGTGTYTTPPTITLADTTPGAAIHYTVDGSSPNANSPLYTVPFSLPASGVVSTIAVAPGYLSSYPNSFFYTINTATAAAPIFSTGTGTFNNPFSVALSSGTTGATVYYTTDGSNPTTSSTPYTHNLTISRGQTVNAIAAAPGYTTSAPASATYTMNLVAPAISQTQNAGAITITVNQPYGNTASPTYYYTLDGSTPTTGSTLYSAPFPLAPTANSYTVHVLAVESGWTNSPIATLGVTIPSASAPAFSPAGGTFTAPTSVTLSSTSVASSIMYTVDGTTPSSTHGTLYASPFTVSSTETVQAVTVSGGNAYVSSAVATANYTIALAPAAAPFMSPYPGTFDTTQTVTLSSTTAGAAIYYTTDGSVPTTTSTLYTAPFPVSASTTVNAIAVHAGNSNSAVASGAYLIQSGTVLANFANGFPAGSLTTTNSGGNLYPTISGNVIQLENNSSGSWGALYFPTKLPVTNFDTSFDFEDVNAAADGLIFVIQNAGSNAVGGSGGSIGFGPGGSGIYANGIPTSVGLKFDLYNNAGEGTDSTGVFLNGAQPYTPSVDMTPSGVILNSSHLLHAHVTYDGTNLLLTLQDSVTGAIFTHSFTVDIPGTVGGNIAYVGFSAASGSYNATQTLYRWTYASTAQAAATPTLSLAAGTYTGPQPETLATSTTSAKIYYTTNGATPTSSSTLYTGAFNVNSSETVKAIAVASGYLNSDIASAAYTINQTAAAAPVIYPAGGTYANNQGVTVFSNNGGNIYYTTDGSTPTANSTLYTPSIVVTQSETIKAIVIGAPGYLNSAVSSATFVITH